MNVITTSCDCGSAEWINGHFFHIFQVHQKYNAATGKETPVTVLSRRYNNEMKKREGGNELENLKLEQNWNSDTVDPLTHDDEQANDQHLSLTTEGGRFSHDLFYLIHLIHLIPVVITMQVFLLKLVRPNSKKTIKQ